MELWSELFSDWVGLLSFLVIAFMVGMVAFFIAMFVGKSHEDPEA